MTIFIKDMDDSEYIVIDVAEARYPKADDKDEAGATLCVLNSAGHKYLVNSISKSAIDILKELFENNKSEILGNVVRKGTGRIFDL